jgi:tetratricopeptide (TPR) repeat protein
MTAHDKLVYISYRHADLLKALAVSQKISAEGFNACIDHGEAGNQEAEKANFQQIKARPHFILILTPTALEGCSDPADPLRREVETAFDRRNLILTLLCDGASFDDPHFHEQLSGPFLRLLNHPHVSAPKGRLAQALPILCSELRNAIPAAQNRVIVNAVMDVKVNEPGAEDVPPPTEAVPALTAQEWFERGDQAEDAQEKIRCFSEAIRVQPDFAEAYAFRGQARESEDVAGALEDMTRAIELEPGSANRYNSRGEYLDHLGDYAGAIRDLDEAIRLDPGFAIAYNNRGDAHREKGDLEAALQDFTRAIELVPDFFLFYLNRGNVFKDKRDFQAALDDCNQAIQLQPNFAGAYNSRGSAWRGMNNLDAAIADYTTAIQLDPGTAYYFYNRGLTYHQKGDLYRAAVDYFETIRLQPDHYEAYYNRAALRYATGDLAGAIRDYDKTLQIKPGYVAAYQERARAHLKNRDAASATADLKTFLSNGGVPSVETGEIEKMLAALIPKE